VKTLSSSLFTLFVAGGCTMMVNGKPHRIGGSDPDPQPTAAATAPSAPASTGTTAKAPAGPVAMGKPGQVITVDAALTATPVVTDIGQVGFDTTYSHVFGINANSPDCGNDITSQPIASIELKQAMPKMEVTVVGGSNDGFVLRNAKGVWFACEETTGGFPSINGLKEGWQPGRYDIYAVSRYGKNATHPFSVEVSDSSKPAPWPEKLKTISLPGKLASPMFVEVTTQPNRRIAREARAGWGCSKEAFASDPDLALVLERPIPGLVVRPLPSAAPVNLRREARDAKKANKGCPTFNHDYNSAGPSYHAEHEIHFDKEDEGTFGISIGTADATKPTTVTLMIYDASTKLDALAPFAGGAAATLEDRWLGRTFPQLDLRELDQRSYAHQELTAKAFALAPKSTFVYAKLDFDKDIASGNSDSFPVKNEALLVTGYERGGSVDVLTADGLSFRVKETHVLLAPEGTAVVPAAPRALHKLDLGEAMGMLPPSAKNLAAAHDKRIAAHEACVDRVWAPYGRQLPTYTHPAGVEIVTYESPRERAIKEAGNNAVDRTCGTGESVEKGSEQERVKMVAAIEKARAKLLAEATAAWH
jgi:hypothetical protein